MANRLKNMTYATTLSKKGGEKQADELAALLNEVCSAPLLLLHTAP
jgi:hypothetical protein